MSRWSQHTIETAIERLATDHSEVGWLEQRVHLPKQTELGGAPSLMFPATSKLPRDQPPTPLGESANGWEYPPKLTRVKALAGHGLRYVAVGIHSLGQTDLRCRDAVRPNGPATGDTNLRGVDLVQAFIGLLGAEEHRGAEGDRCP